MGTIDLCSILPPETIGMHTGLFLSLFFFVLRFVCTFLVCHYILSIYRPKTRFQSICKLSLEPEAVCIVRDGCGPVCENFRGTDLLRNGMDDLVLVSVVFDEV